MLFLYFTSHENMPMDISVSKNFPGNTLKPQTTGGYHSHAYPNQGLLYYVWTSMHYEHNMRMGLHVIRTLPQKARLQNDL